MAIKKTSTGYQVQWYDSSQKFRKRTYRGVTREMAERLERDILRERDLGGVILDPKHAPTFADAARQWLESNRAHWKASTKEQWQSVIDVHLAPAWATRRVSTLTESDAVTLQNTLQQAGLGARRSNLIITAAKAVLQFAVRRQWMRVAPFTHVRPLKESRSDVDPLAKEEITRFLAACPVWWRPYFTVAVWTGLRPSEQQALTWDDISERSLHVGAGLRRGVLDTPKTSSSVRDVDLLPTVVEALRAQRAQQAAMRLRRGLPAPARDHVFTDELGRPVDQDILRRGVWHQTLKRAGLRRRAVYHLRHTFASTALGAGESPAWVAQQLGHSGLHQLFTTYARFIPNVTRRDGSALAAHLGSDREHLSAQEHVTGEQLGG